MTSVFRLVPFEESPFPLLENSNLGTLPLNYMAASSLAGQTLAQE